MANLTTITLSASGSVTSSGSFSTIDNTFGVAGTANVNVATIQGISGATPVIATGTLAISGTSNVALTGTGTVLVAGTSNVAITGTGSILVVGTSNVAIVSAVTVPVSGSFSFTSGTVTVASITGTSFVSVVNANTNGRTTPANCSPTVLASQTYTSVAANSTTTLMGATGAVGDYLDGLLVVPASVSPGAVSILDNTTAMTVVAGGTTSLTNLVPFYVPLGAISRSGGWHVTTGSTIAVIASGNFT